MLLGVPPLSLLRLTEEVRGLFAGMGSILVKSVKARDNWVFAGTAGGADRSLYEKVSEHLSTPPPPHHSTASPDAESVPCLVHLSDSCQRKENQCLRGLAEAGGGWRLLSTDPN